MKRPFATWLRQLANGTTLQQIGDRHGITREWVRRLLNKYDAKALQEALQKSRDGRADERLQVARRYVQLRRDGIPARKAARQVNRSPKSMNSLLRNARKTRPDEDWALPKQYHWTPGQIRRIWRARQNGKTWREAGALYGVSGAAAGNAVRWRQETQPEIFHAPKRRRT